MIRVTLALLLALFLLPSTARAADCSPDRTQTSGSIYRICMPPAGTYNGMLIVWAHGFQDAGTKLQIPEDQLCSAGVCVADVATGLGFGFATNSYSKTGLAVVQGEADILDLVHLYAAEQGPPRKVYIVGASEGGLIAAREIEQHPNVFSAGLAACGPIGDFNYQLSYFGDARATFQYFFAGLIPGDPFHPTSQLIGKWASYYSTVVEPTVFAPANRSRLDQWVRVAKLPYDPNDYLGSLHVTVSDVLRYSVVNLNDAASTLGGFPFDNRGRFYIGSNNDLLLNIFVPRVSADASALASIQSGYQTTGILSRPLVTLHTTRDQQVPFRHEQLYALKTIASGAFLTRHVPIVVDRFEHCNFTSDELLNAFYTMLVYDAIVPQ